MEFLVMLAAVVTLSVPGRTNANVSMASDGDRVAVVWAATSAAAGNGSTDIYLATSRDGGRTFGAPVRVNDVEGEARVTGEQPPRVVYSRAAIVVSWVSKREGTTIRFARSIDGGRTFGPSRAVSRAGAPGSRGWQAMTVDRHGDVEIAWLDHRALADAHAGHEMEKEHGTADGAVMAERSALYIARVTPEGVQPEERITTGVCYCCKTALASAADGAIVAAWRHVYAGNMRDIAFTRSVNGRTFSPPARVSADRWALNGCPDDGPAVVTDAGSRTHIVWPTVIKKGDDPEMALFYAASPDGRTFTPREQLPTRGVAHHPEIAIARGGSLLMTWDESIDYTRHVAMARGVADADGRMRFTRAPLDGPDEGMYPIAAPTTDGFVIAWTAMPGDGSIIRVERLPARETATNSSRAPLR